MFRAQRADTKEWVEGYIARVHRRNEKGEIESYFFNALDELGWSYECIVSAETVCQYAGLNDSTKWEELSEDEKEKFLSERNHKEDRLNTKEDWNGRRIFEGDVLSCSHSRLKEGEDERDFMPEYEEYTRNYAVEFVNKGGHCGYRCRNKSIHFTLTQNTVYNHDINVIGNLWDNPELLNQ